MPSTKTEIEAHLRLLRETLPEFRLLFLEDRAFWQMVDVLADSIRDLAAPEAAEFIDRELATTYADLGLVRPQE